MARNVVVALVIALCLGGPIIWVTALAQSEVRVHDDDKGAHSEQFKEIAKNTAEITANQQEFRFKIADMSKDLDAATEERKAILKAIQELNAKLDRR